MSTAFTLFLVIIPSIINVFLTRMAVEDAGIIRYIPYMTATKNMNAILNLFLYVTRHEDMRNAVICLLLCRSKLPVSPNGKISVGPTQQK